MKFIIDRSDLMANIQHLVPIVPSKNAMPILTNYLIEADEQNNNLKVTATDLEITVIVEFEANVEQGGRVCVSARNFTQIIASLPDSKVTCEKQDDLIHINCGKSNFSLLCAETSQYPLIPEKDMENATELDALTFKKMINTTEFAVSTEANRAIFTGIYWKLATEKQIMAATDGKKIAEYKVNSTLNIDEEIDCILPIKGLKFLNKVISEDCLELKALIEKNRVMFEYDNYTIFSHILEGRYPDYSRAIPEHHSNILKINKGILHDAIRRVSLLASDESHRIQFDLEGSKLGISTQNREVGDALEELDNVNYNGEKLTIAFNYRYLLQIIGVVTADDVEIKFGQAKEPILVSYQHAEDNTSSLFLLMPLRIS